MFLQALLHIFNFTSKLENILKVRALDENRPSSGQEQAKFSTVNYLFDLMAIDWLTKLRDPPGIVFAAYATAHCPNALILIDQDDTIWSSTDQFWFTTKDTCIYKLSPCGAD